MWWALGLLAYGLLLHAQTVSFGIIRYDTPKIVLSHPELYDPTSLLSSLRHIFWQSIPREEPLLLRDVTWAIDSRLFGHDNPFGYRLGNVAINALNGALLFLALRRMTGLRALALWTALLWASLPVHVQPIAWIMGRKDLLVMSASMLALLVGAQVAETEGRARRHWTAVLWALIPVAMFSKFSAITLFVVLALQQSLWPYLSGRCPPGVPLPLRSMWRPAWPTLAYGAVVSFGIYAFYSHNLTALGVLGGRGPSTLSAEHLSLLSRFIPMTLAIQLKHVLWPGQYSLQYLRPNANLDPELGSLVAGYAVTAALVALAVFCIRRRRDLLFPVLAAALTMAPYLNIVYIGYWVADRYVYVASAFVLWTVAYGVLWLVQRMPKLRRAFVALGVGATLLYSASSVVYAGAWRSNLTLWQHEVRLDEPSVLAWEAFAKALLHEARQAGGEQRASLIAMTAQTAELGLRYYEALPLRQDTSYRVTEQLYAAKLCVVLGELAQLQGQPPDVVLQHFHRAYGLAVDPKTTLSLAAGYMALGQVRDGEARQAALLRSLSYFAEHMQTVQGDATRLHDARQMLERNYAARYPSLSEQVDALRARYADER